MGVSRRAGHAFYAGRVLRISFSSRTRRRPRDRALYSATKGAVYSLTLAMAADYVREHIRVNCVNPGTADTPWIGRLLAAAWPACGSDR
jgi:2-keto-3-deoxy-L-fuconate dehydrogenase